MSKNSELELIKVLKIQIIKQLKQIITNLQMEYQVAMLYKYWPLTIKKKTIIIYKN